MFGRTPVLFTLLLLSFLLCLVGWGQVCRNAKIHDHHPRSGVSRGPLVATQRSTQNVQGHRAVNRWKRDLVVTDAVGEWREGARKNPETGRASASANRMIRWVVDIGG